MPSYLLISAVVACLSALWFGLNPQPFTFNTLRLQRQFANTIAQRTTTTEPFFYKLSLQWPPAICNSSGWSCKSAIRPLRFTIHGIWSHYLNDTPVPPYNQTTNPCTNVKPARDSVLPEALSPIQRDLEYLWPNLKDSKNLKANIMFWRHEWRKHGMCSDYPNKPIEYFKSALQLRNCLNPLMGLEVGSTYTVQAVADVVWRQVKASAEITCNRNKVNEAELQLSEIRLCYEGPMHNLTIRNCTKKFSNQCKRLTDIITFPNISWN